MQIKIGSYTIAYVTPDGMRWLDADGNTPNVDEKGRLKAPFIYTKFELDGVTIRLRERWEPPAVLPLTPAALKIAGLTPSETDADDGNNGEGEVVAVSSPAEKKQFGESKPAPKPTGRKGIQKRMAEKNGNGKPEFDAALDKSIKRNAEATEKAKKGRGVAGPRPNSAAGKAASKPTTAALKKATVDEKPSKPAAGSVVYIRHMRTPRDAYVLIKNPSVFGSTGNWVTEKEFKSAEEAEKWAKDNGLRVVNGKK